jgi:hypothetical protein
MSANRLHWALLIAASAVGLAVFVLFVLPVRKAESPQPPVADSTGPAIPTGEASLPREDFPVSGMPTPVATFLPSAAGEWEDRLDGILSTDGNDELAVNQLLAALPSLPLEAKEEYVGHALNLCADEDYAKIEQVYLAGDTPPEVSEGIFDDVLNRPDEVKLPLLAKTLRNPAHPMASEAREILEMYLDLEEGTVPPSGWEPAVQQYLADNPGQ